MADAIHLRKRFVIRLRALAGLFIVLAVLLILRLYFIQIVHGDEYAKEAVGQYQEPAQETLQRGDIFFKAKDGVLVAAAVMQTGARIAINPKVLKDPQEAYSKLSALTRIDRDTFFSSAAKKSDPYEEVAFRVSDDAADKVRAAKIPGVIVVSDLWRFYPGEMLAAQALGFVGFKENSVSKVGVYGLEKYYDSTLTQTSSGLYTNAFAEIFANLQSVLSTDPTAHQGSIVTSIEPKVQQELEVTLDSVMKKYTPNISGGIIMDPKTGEIYAIAGRPAYDPNTYNTVSNPAVFDNQLVSGRYELGSIMKPLTMAAAIDAGAVTASTTYKDTGCIERSTYKICNFDLEARGVIPVQKILNESLNVGAAFLADTMGHSAFTRYVRMYGLGEKTGIDLPNEVTGDLSTLKNGTGPEINFDTAAYGQGISVSPIEMIRALSVLANGGKLPSPHVVTAIKYENGVTRSVTPALGVQVLKPKTVDTVTNMLITVYDTGLLKGKYKKEHYTIAAKTGTAQIPKKGGGYLEGDTYLHSFFGYFPAHDPKFIVFLFATEPHGQKYASATLAEPFNDIATFLINYYNIAPDR